MDQGGGSTKHQYQEGCLHVYLGWDAKGMCVMAAITPSAAMYIYPMVPMEMDTTQQ